MLPKAQKQSATSSEHSAKLNNKKDDSWETFRNKGYFPAYHMNKKSWLTVLLDGSVNDDELKDLIHLSYEIIEKKNKF
jgi:predicted DNA-binding protein (MmcQ/YjbR family)